MNVVLCYSGGMDSTALLYLLLQEGHGVRCLSVDYGQRHARELRSARHICELNRVEHRVADLSSLRPLLAGSSQTDPSVPVPHGHYAEESMKKTVVPNRNMILLSLATAWAVSVKADAVAYAAHAGDHAIYPDCRPPFIHKMSEVINLCDWREMKLLTPFSSLTKADVAYSGYQHGVPFQETWTCYEGGDKHCGKCGACTERREAFQLAGVPDPTEYA